MMKHARMMMKKGRLGSVICLLGLGLMMLAFTGCSDDGNNTDSGSGSTGDSSTTSSADLTSATASSTGGTATPSSGTVQAAGILWKPISEGNGRLVVLLPVSMGVPGAKILASNGTLVDTGTYYGSPAEHGSRAIYRFNSPGSSYPKPCKLQVGSVVYDVPAPAKRYN